MGRGRRIVNKEITLTQIVPVSVWMLSAANNRGPKSHA